MITAELDDDDKVRRSPVAVKRSVVRYDDPDKQFDSLFRVVETQPVQIDAKLIEGYHEGRPIVRHYRSLREVMQSPSVRKRIREHYTGRDAKDISTRLREASNEFALGLYDDEALARTQGGRVFSVQDAALPSLNSPYAKQQMFADYMAAHSKCFEAWIRNPIAKRIARIIPQFVLGRGVAGAHKSKAHQDAWNEFWLDNRLRLRLKQILRELIVYGELFLRYYQTKDGLVVRSIDPSTIWDIVTDPDDVEQVKYYHQQYVVAQPALIGRPVLPSTVVIRQIPAEEIDHFKINSTSSEKRGRSELFSILGWLIRFREFANDRVLLNKMRSMFALDVSVEGDANDLAMAEAQFNTPPGPGAVFIHNNTVAVQFLNANNNANEAKTDGELLLKIIAVGAGVSEQFLGVSAAGTRAGALIQTEPDVKNFEDYREVVEEILTLASRRVFKAKKLAPPDLDMEFIFPALAQEDRSAKLRDIAFAEAMDYFSKERSASMAAREFEITTYDFKAERKVIERERAESPVMAQGMQQMTKIAPDPQQGAPENQPGLGSDLVPGKPDPMSHASGQMGFPDDIGGRGLPNTKATLNRAEFTRGGEKEKIAKNRTSGTPLRHADGGEPLFTGRRGWTEAARLKSLAVRREKARLRREQLGVDPAPTDGTQE